MKVDVPATPKPSTTKYDNLKGVDYSVDPSQVHRRRTPGGKNMIPDESGNPEKRKGWQVLHETESQIDNLWSFVYNGQRYNVMTSGLNMIEFTDTELFEPYALASSGKKIGVYAQSPAMAGLFVFDDTKIIRAYPVEGRIIYSEIEYYTPLVIIGRDPRRGGGVLYENINKMTRKRKERFLNSTAIVGSGWTADSGANTLTSATAHGLSVGDPIQVDVGTGTLPGGIELSRTYYVKTKTSTEITIAETSGGTEVNITSAGTTGFYVKSYSLTFLCTGTIDQTKEYKAYRTTTSGAWVEATIDSVDGATVTLATKYAPIGSEDNIEIVYFATGSNTSQQICKCRAWARYNPQTVDQIFVTSCDLAGYGQYVFYSANGDISYWPDQNYIYIGGSGTKIAGFLNVSDSIAVVKEDNSQEMTIFFLSKTTLAVTSADGSTTDVETYAAKQTSASVGAAGGAMGVLIDDPLFLAPTGIYGISSKNYTTEKIIRNRSVYVNPRLSQESLEDAVCCVWKEYFMVFVGGHVYILDGKQKENNNTTGSYVYECYFWDNVPATVVMSFDQQIYFSGLVGEIYSLCKFNTSNAASSYNDNGEAIEAAWTTPYDNDNCTEFFKVMQKKGSMCTVKPFSHSSVKIYGSADGEARVLIGSGNSSKGSFSGMSFGGGTFRGSSFPQDKFFNKKKKKYKRLQLTVENAELNQGFGVVEIVKTWYPTRYARS